MKRSLLLVLVDFRSAHAEGRAEGRGRAEPPRRGARGPAEELQRFERSFDLAPRFPQLHLRAPPESEGASLPSGRCNTFDGAQRCSIEWDEWVMVRALITPRRAVMEFGARYGTTSCVLAAATNNSGSVVSIEPDARVHAHLRHNRDAHACNFHIVRGTVSKRKLAQGRGGSYETRTRVAGAHEAALDNFALAEIERWIGARIDTLLVDCEGCINYLPDELFAQADLVLVEEDWSGSVTVNYTAQGERLRRTGLERFWRIHGSAKSGMAGGYHSAWRRPGTRAARGLPTCEEYKRRMRFTEHELSCAAVPV